MQGEPRQAILRQQPRSAVTRRRARLRPTRAAILVGVLAVAGCGSSDPELPPPPCPGALLLDGAERTAGYRAGAEPRPSELRYLAVLTDLSSACRYYDDGARQGVDVDLTFNLVAERGPALTGVEELTYFVATVGPGRQVRSEHVLRGDLSFAESEQRTGWTEELTLRLPSITPAQAPDYVLYVGFKLDDAELTRREQPLLR
jgi:hypothetical protein